CRASRRRTSRGAGGGREIRGSARSVLEPERNTMRRKQQVRHRSRLGESGRQSISFSFVASQRSHTHDTGPGCRSSGHGAAPGMRFEFSESPAPSPMFWRKYLIPLDLGLSITYVNPFTMNGLWLKISSPNTVHLMILMAL